MWPIVAFLLYLVTPAKMESDYETACYDLTDDTDAYYTATESLYSTSSQPKARKKKKKKKRRERREKLIETEWTYVGNKNDDEVPNLVVGNPATDLVCVSTDVYILRPANAAASLPILNMPPPGQPEAQPVVPVVWQNKADGQVSNKRDSEKVNQNGEKAKKQAIEKAKTNIEKSLSTPAEPFQEPSGVWNDVANNLEMGIQNLEEKIKNEFEAKLLQNDTVEPMAFDFRESFNDMWSGLDDDKPGSPLPGADKLWSQRRFSLADNDIQSLFPLPNKKN